MRKIYLLLLSLILLPYMAVAQNNTGVFTVTGGTLGTDYTYSEPPAYEPNDAGILTVNTSTHLTISTSGGTASPANGRIVIGNGVTANITLAGLSIEPAAPNSGPGYSGINLGSGATLNITLQDGTVNEIHGGTSLTGLPGPGIHLPAGSTLTINGSGSLEVHGASGNDCGAVGIGGMASASEAGGACGNVLILGGTIKVHCGTPKYSIGKQPVDIGGGTSDMQKGGDCNTVIILTPVNSGGGLTIGGGAGSSIGGGNGSDGQGIRPSGDGSYTVWGELTVPSDVAFPEGITLNIPSGTTLNLPDTFTWPENITVMGDGMIKPDTMKVPAKITFKENLSKTATGNRIELVEREDYSYNGNGKASIKWFTDIDGTKGNQKYGAPEGNRYFRVEVSAQETALYKAASADIKIYVAKGTPNDPTAPTTSEVKAGSITVNTVSGQKYICTTSSTAPDLDDEGWIDATGSIYTFENLQPATQYYIHTFIPENEYFEESDLTSVEVNTLAEYTIAFDSQGGSEVAEQTVEEGGKIAKPENPTCLNHIFNGWYSDEACIVAWDFNTVVSESMTLYAKWTELLIKAEGETEISLSMDAGSMTLTAIIESEVDLSAGGKWNWESSDKSVATVTPNEGEPILKGSATVTAKGAGTAEITATYTSDNYTGSISYTLTVTEPEPEEPDTPVIPDYPDYYNIYVDECEGVTVETSTNVVREGNSMSFTIEVAEGYTAEDMVVKVKRSLFGYTDVIEPNEEGKYEIRNIWTEIYITVEGVEKETPTGIEEITESKVYAKDGSLYVQTPKQEEVRIISISGAVIKNETQIGLQRYDLPRGIYIICIGEERVKVRN